MRGYVHEIGGIEMIRISSLLCDELVQTDFRIYCHDPLNASDPDIMAYNGTGWFAPDWNSAVYGPCRQRITAGLDGSLAITTRYGYLVIIDANDQIVLKEDFETFGVTDANYGGRGFAMINPETFILSGTAGKMAHLTDGQYKLKTFNSNYDMNQIVMEESGNAWGRLGSMVYRYGE